MKNERNVSINRIMMFRPKRDRKRFHSKIGFNSQVSASIHTGKNISAYPNFWVRLQEAATDGGAKS